MKEKIMAEVIQKAKENMNQGIGGPFGAAIVRDGKVITITSNSVLKDGNPTCHAEMNAIKEASQILHTYDLSDCELYATGYPCPMCMGAILWANIKTVYYGSTLEDATKIGFRDEFFYDKIEQKKLADIVSLENINHEECIHLLEEYQEKERKMY